MSRALVTGAAGFIGSHLIERLLDDGHEVVGVDSFSTYYDPALKRANLAVAQDFDRFVLHELDLARAPLGSLLDGIDWVFHFAGQPGVRSSWGGEFGAYTTNNVLATQRLLEDCMNKPVQQIVFASSSSVYGRAEAIPTPESATPRPISPYGVTKLTAEHLCGLYAMNFGVPAVSLRYFTVYGPRQRPDMAICRMIRAATQGDEFVVFGDGNQIRDFTFVLDAVEASVLAAARSVDPGTVMNIGGGTMASIASIVSLVEAEIGRKLRLSQTLPAHGDPRATGADTARAQSTLGWRPATALEDGVRAQVAWCVESGVDGKRGLLFASQHHAAVRTGK